MGDEFDQQLEVIHTTNYNSQDYLKSLKWFCDDSPTAGHHWLVSNFSKRVWQCKYCLCWRAYPLTIPECVVFEHTPKVMGIYHPNDLPILLNVLHHLPEFWDSRHKRGGRYRRKIFGI